MADSYKDLPKTMDKLVKELNELPRLNKEQEENLNKLFGGKIF